MCQPSRWPNLKRIHGFVYGRDDDCTRAVDEPVRADVYIMWSVWPAPALEAGKSLRKVADPEELWRNHEVSRSVDESPPAAFRRGQPIREAMDVLVLRRDDKGTLIIDQSPDGRGSYRSGIIWTKRSSREKGRSYFDYSGAVDISAEFAIGRELGQISGEGSDACNRRCQRPHRSCFLE